MDNAGASGVYYIRTAVPEAFSEIESERAGNGAVITVKTDLEKVMGLIDRANDPELFIADVV